MPHERYICEILSKQVSKQVMSRSINITVQFFYENPFFFARDPLPRHHPHWVQSPPERTVKCQVSETDVVWCKDSST